jgi:hypothetical protein
MPLVWDLTAELKASLARLDVYKLNKRWVAHGAGHPPEAIDKLAALLAMPNVHYESILGNLELQYMRGGGHGIAQNYHGLYAWLAELVSHALLLRHYKRVDFIETGMVHYSGVAKLADDNLPLWVFSLNHDVLVECIAAYFGTPLSSGFGSPITLPRRNKAGEVIGRLTADVLTGEEIEKLPLAFFELNTKGINLLKLHGSLDVFAFRDGQDLLKIRPLEPSVHGVIDALRAANEELSYVEQTPPGMEPWHATNEIIYGDDDGEAQFLRRSLMAGAFKFTDRHKQVLPKRLLAHFRSNLNCLTKLICIGYSFNDIHINQIVRDWIDFHASRSIEIVSPGIKDVPPFLSHLPDQVAIVAASATEYFESCLANPPAQKQKMDRALRALVREAERKIAGFA